MIQNIYIGHSCREYDNLESDIPYKQNGEFLYINQRLLYSSPACVKSWIDNIENNPRNGLEIRKLEAKQVGKLNLGKDDDGKNRGIRWVSIGCGAGYHDRIISRKLNEKNEVIEYIPIDFSYNMLLSVLNQLAESRCPINPIYIDFNDIIEDESVMNKFFPETSNNAPTVFTILGNTFGNNGEEEAIACLKKIMKAGDYLIIGYSLTQTAADYTIHPNTEEFLLNGIKYAAFINNSNTGVNQDRTISHKKILGLFLNKKLCFINTEIQNSEKHTLSGLMMKNKIPFTGKKELSEEQKEIISSVVLGPTSNESKTPNADIKNKKSKNNTNKKPLIIGKTTRYGTSYIELLLEKAGFTQQDKESNNNYVCETYMKEK